MRVNIVFCAMLLAGVLFSLATGRADAAQQALLDGGAQAVELCLSLAGAYAFFGGLLGVMRETGAADALARLLERPLAALLRFAPGEEAALQDVSLNLAANMLGMGSAATPAGLRAMRALAASGRCPQPVPRERAGRRTAAHEAPATDAAAGQPAELFGTGHSPAASDAMILFLVINVTGVQLLPTTMIALRAQAGAASPADIVPATLAATAAATVAGVLACKLFARVWP